MKDRDVPVTDLIKAYKKLGCFAEYEKGFLSIHRPEQRGIKQHLHKGKYDTVRRLTVRSLYRSLGFTAEEFYKALER